MDVAREAKVSHMTVSRVVKNIHAVSPETKSRVESAIRKLGYRPDPVLSALANYRSQVIKPSHGNVLAYINCEEPSEFLINQDVYWEGAQREAKYLGYELEPIKLGRNQDQRRLSKMLYYRGIRGVIIGPTYNAWNFEGFKWENFAAVSLSPLRHQPNFHSVTVDAFDAASMGYRYLEQKGCKRIGLVLADWANDRSGYRYLGGYHAAHGRKGAKTFIFEHANPNVKSFTSWMKESGVDGVLTIHSEVWFAAFDLGIKVVLLNSFEKINSVPTCILDYSLIGKEGMILIHDLLLRREYGISDRPKTVLLKTVLKRYSPDVEKQFTHEGIN